MLSENDRFILLNFTLPFVVLFSIGWTLKTYLWGEHPRMYLANILIVFLVAIPATWAASRWSKAKK